MTVLTATTKTYFLKVFIEIVYWLSSKSFSLIFFTSLFVLNLWLAAYKGIMRWQGKVWRLIGNLISGTTSSKGGDCDAATLAEWEDKLYNARNSAVKEASSCLSFFYNYKF